MKAEIEIECERPDIVVKALGPETEETKKFTVKIEAGKDRLKLKLEAEDVSGLLAGINSYMRLIKTSIDGLEA
jgi:tRNA threonylcarbamoyladenosine modification (KEOPS) complex  Pcc1 subunit